MESFYVSGGDGFLATEHTRGPWHPDVQHGGPPSALLGRAMESLLGPGMQIARLTVEFVRPIPIGRVTVAAQVVRAGRKVQTLAAALSAGGVEICRAHALAIRTTSLAIPAVTLPADPAPAAPESSPPLHFYFFQAEQGYHTGMEARIARGTMGTGPTAVWMRMRVPLLPGETPSPWQRALIAADSGNGVSLVLDTTRLTFVNPDLTVALHRLPVGEWVCLDAATWPNGNGVGLADTRLWDAQGVVGRGLQTLVIDERT